MKKDRSNDVFSTRYRLIVAIIAVLMAILAVRLFIVTVVQHDSWVSRGYDQSTKTIYTDAPRGDILDRNGKVIATTDQMFTVTFNPSGMTTEEINASALELIDLLEADGDEYTDKFPIKIASDGSMYYTYDVYIRQWLESMDLPTGLTAKETMSALASRYDITDTEDRFELYEILTEKYNLSIPIDAKTMRFDYTNQKRNFLAKWGIYKEEEIKAGVSAKDCFGKLRENYRIDESMSDEDARKIFIVRNEIASAGFIRYNPITLAKDVSEKTIAMVEEGDIKGAGISSQYKRSYPYGNFASHILGYMGSISDDETSHYVDELGYSATDIIGKSGIEAAYEEKLHGTPGVREIQVNSAGEYVSTVKETSPEKGKDVYLTIDLDLQKAAEDALERQIRKVGGKCQSGAVIVMDVKTGEILALASYPDYDPNIFATGITTKAWASVQSRNPRDPISPAPLYNNATMAAVPPGSTFKPITALTALRLGLDPNQYIYDNMFIEMGGHKWATDAYNTGKGSYGSENLELGLGHSSNYYFYCIGTGKNWGTGASLGYKITIEDIMQTASDFGLGQKTGIELYETVRTAPNAKSKMAGYKASLWQWLYSNARTYFPAEVADDYDRLTENLDKISSWIEENPDYTEIAERLKETDVKDDLRHKLAERIKYDFFTQAEWTVGDQFNISIGQGDNAYTPVQVVTYISALGNGGTYNRASLVREVEGEGLIDKSADRRKIDIRSSDIKNVLKGMRYVCTGGTLSSFFADFKVPVAGKTGTAENQGIPQPASEVAYIKSHLSSINAAAGTSVTWSQIETQMDKMMKESPDRFPSQEDTVDAALKAVSGYRVTDDMINASKGSYDQYAWTVTLAPYDDPEIAVVTLLIQGGYSYNAAPVNKALIEKYFELNGGKDE